MIVDVICATLNPYRVDFFLRLCESVKRYGEGASLHVQFETEVRRVADRWNPLYKASTGAIVLWLMDDMELMQDTIPEIVTAFVVHFPDYDGIVGVAQDGHPDAHPYAVMAIGRKFLDRYPDREVVCPDYHHLHVDTEIGLWAEKLGRFRFVPTAKVKHDHPAWTKRPQDETHHAARRGKNLDDRIYQARRAKGLIWGESMERVTHERSDI